MRHPRDGKMRIARRPEKVVGKVRRQSLKKTEKERAQSKSVPYRYKRENQLGTLSAIRGVNQLKRKREPNNGNHHSKTPTTITFDSSGKCHKKLEEGRLGKRGQNPEAHKNPRKQGMKGDTKKQKTIPLL